MDVKVCYTFRRQHLNEEAFSMTDVEAIILSAATRAKIRTSAELARRSGIPPSTMRDKMNHPGKIRLSDLSALCSHISLTPEELAKIVKRCR